MVEILKKSGSNKFIYRENQNFWWYMDDGVWEKRILACGSSASWLIKNIIYNKGGLHNRVTCNMQLMPFNREPFVIDKSYAKKLQHNMALFKKITGTKKQLFLLFISANGLTPSMYSEEIVSHVVTLEDMLHA